jgi:hypothetical protein
VDKRFAVAVGSGFNDGGTILPARGIAPPHATGVGLRVAASMKLRAKSKERKTKLARKAKSL